MRGSAAAATPEHTMASESKASTKRVGKWYFGGIASAMAACGTHPLDLLKVHLQTQQEAKVGFLTMGVRVFKSEGVMGLYNGLSASLGRQFTYSLTRFAVYEIVKARLTENGRTMPFYEKVLLAGASGALGGFVGTPADMINVRMQNDMKLPRELRRNYRHVFDGAWRVVRDEGATKLFNGAVMASSRAVLVTIGQLAFYDQIKYMLLKTGHFSDNLTTHLTASFLAGAIATAITQPFDVMKTRLMNAKPGQYPNMAACARDVASTGPLGFFKGFVPAFVRLGPHTILTFVFFEQLRLRFGDDVPA